MTDNKKKDIDELSGIETTGHEWDGLKELNNPLPRWWLWVFYATVIWSVYYFIVYPSWPIFSSENQGGTVGTSGYTQFKELANSQNEILARQQIYLDKFEQASFKEILDDPGLYAFAMAGGHAAFKDNCATCHGTGAQGSKGYPNLNDDDWIWGGTVEEIHTTLLHGIRVAGDYDTRISDMPAFGKDGTLTRKQINEVVEYILALSEDGNPQSLPGHVIFQQNCASCHGPRGKGMHEFGAPNLTDAIWLYGGSKKEIYETVFHSRRGMMPAWKSRLDGNTLRQLAVYVHQLGGGEEENSIPQSSENLTEVMEAPAEISDNEMVSPQNILELAEPPEDVENEQ